MALSSLAFNSKSLALVLNVANIVLGNELTTICKELDTYKNFILGSIEKLDLKTNLYRPLVKAC